MNKRYCTLAAKLYLRPRLNLDISNNKHKLKSNTMETWKRRDSHQNNESAIILQESCIQLPTRISWEGTRIITESTKMYILELPLKLQLSIIYARQTLSNYQRKFHVNSVLFQNPRKLKINRSHGHLCTISDYHQTLRQAFQNYRNCTKWKIPRWHGERRTLQNTRKWENSGLSNYKRCSNFQPNK